MKLKNTMLMAIALAAAAGCARQDQKDTGAPPSAELALKNGAIYTVDGARSWAEAVAIREGRIVFVGTSRDLERFIGPATKLVDLKGRMLMPAFQDSHVHPISGGVEANGCDLHDLEVFDMSVFPVVTKKRESVDRYLAAINACGERSPDAAWIIGGGWVLSAFGPGGLASRKLLDAIIPDRPVYLESTDGHSAWVNSKALDLAGITNDTPDPPDGRIDRDENGVAIGTLQEGAVDLVFAKIPPTTADQLQDGLRYSVRMLNGLGITTIQDANVDEADLKTYQALEASGELTLRVVGSIWWERERGLEQLTDIRRLSKEYTAGLVDARTVKIMQDGVMENFTSAMLEPFLLPGDVRGIPMIEPDQLKDIVRQLDAEDFQVHFHAIGDAAIRQSLDAVEAARDANGERGNRHHISHLQLIDPADIPRFRELGVVANFQPLWAIADTYITELTMPFIGPKRSAWLYPIGSVYRSGAVVAFGSDWSVSSANPLEEIEAAVTREPPLMPAGKTTESFIPGERIDLPAAIAAFTINPAWVNRLERQTGSVEVGKLADLIILDRNLFAIPLSELNEATVLVTLFEGKPVHGDLGAL